MPPTKKSAIGPKEVELINALLSEFGLATSKETGLAVADYATLVKLVEASSVFGKLKGDVLSTLRTLQAKWDKPGLTVAELGSLIMLALKLNKLCTAKLKSAKPKGEFQVLVEKNGILDIYADTLEARKAYLKAKGFRRDTKLSKILPHIFTNSSLGMATLAGIAMPEGAEEGNNEEDAFITIESDVRSGNLFLRQIQLTPLGVFLIVAFILLLIEIFGDYLPLAFIVAFFVIAYFNEITSFVFRLLSRIVEAAAKEEQELLEKDRKTLIALKSKDDEVREKLEKLDRMEKAILELKKQVHERKKG